jgi:hypothetical protein
MREAIFYSTQCDLGTIPGSAIQDMRTRVFNLLTMRQREGVRNSAKAA